MSENIEHPNFMELTELEFPIFKATFKPGVQIEYQNVDEAFSAYNNIGRGQKSIILIDLSGIRQVDLLSRRAMVESRFEDRIQAAGVIVRDPISRMLGNFILGINRPRIPVKLFTNEPDALVWARSQKENSEELLETTSHDNK